MITYAHGLGNIFCRVFQCRGSVFTNALLPALPCGVVTALMKFVIDMGFFPNLDEDGSRSVLRDNSCWSGFVFLVGFLTVFRTSQAMGWGEGDRTGAYARFCEGCASVHVMRAEWCDACAALMAFSKSSKANTEDHSAFEQILVRLFSMLHALALAEIEDSSASNINDKEAFKYQLVDPEGLDEQSLRVVRRSTEKVELVFQWIQQLIVENMDTGVLQVPPPILSNAFRELANGMVAFRGALRVSTIAFPFPYAQVCEWLLIMHWLATPIVVSQYVSTPLWGAVFSFLQVFVYWGMNAIAIEIENPFGMDANDLDCRAMQEEVNRHLLLLTEEGTKRTPQLRSLDVNRKTLRRSSKSSLTEVWDRLDEKGRIGSPGSVRSDPLASERWGSSDDEVDERSVKSAPASAWGMKSADDVERGESSTPLAFGVRTGSLITSFPGTDSVQASPVSNGVPMLPLSTQASPEGHVLPSQRETAANPGVLRAPMAFVPLSILQKQGVANAKDGGMQVSFAMSEEFTPRTGMRVQARPEASTSDGNACSRL